MPIIAPTVLNCLYAQNCLLSCIYIIYIYSYLHFKARISIERLLADAVRCLSLQTANKFPYIQSYIRIFAKNNFLTLLHVPRFSRRFTRCNTCLIGLYIIFWPTIPLFTVCFWFLFRFLFGFFLAPTQMPFTGKQKQHVLIEHNTKTIVTICQIYQIANTYSYSINATQIREIMISDLFINAISKAKWN